MPRDWNRLGDSDFRRNAKTLLTLDQTTLRWWPTSIEAVVQQAERRLLDTLTAQQSPEELDN